MLPFARYSLIWNWKGSYVISSNQERFLHCLSIVFWQEVSIQVVYDITFINLWRLSLILFILKIFEPLNFFYGIFLWLVIFRVNLGVIFLLCSPLHFLSIVLLPLAFYYPVCNFSLQQAPWQELQQYYHLIIELYTSCSKPLLLEWVTIWFPLSFYFFLATWLIHSFDMLLIVLVIRNT